MPTLLEVMESRIGVQEIPGAKHNPVIVGWANDAGHPEIVDDETSWCSICTSSAAKEAGLPMPPVNVNTMARSWLTWGVKVLPTNIAPGDVVIWPRGNPAGPFGHVNVVQTIGPDGRIKCVGGNQIGLKGGDAVTVTDWLDPQKAIGFRRPVASTVEDLRPHSSEIKEADQIETSGWFALWISGAVATIKELLAPVAVPQFADLPSALTWWQTVLGGLSALGRLFMENPWLAGSIIGCIICILVARRRKSRRVARHAVGAPIASQVLAMGVA